MALASAKAAVQQTFVRWTPNTHMFGVSAYLSPLSSPQGSLLRESGVVSVLELGLTTVCFSTARLFTFDRTRMSGPSSKSKLIKVLVNRMTDSEVSFPTHEHRGRKRLLNLPRKIHVCYMIIISYRHFISHV